VVARSAFAARSAWRLAPNTSGSQLASSSAENTFPVEPPGELLSLPLPDVVPVTVGKRLAAARFRWARASRKFARAVRRLVLFLSACAIRSDRQPSPSLFHHCVKSPVGLCAVSGPALLHDGGGVIVGCAGRVLAKQPLNKKTLDSKATNVAARSNLFARSFDGSIFPFTVSRSSMGQAGTLIVLPTLFDHIPPACGC
jgi:hypothetical protein